MSERFTYPPGVAGDLQREIKRRRWFWFCFLLPFWLGGLYAVFTGDGWVGALIVVGISGMAALMESSLRGFARQTLELVGHALEYDGTRLRQLAPDGVVIGEIDLSAPFDVTFPYSAVGNAVYKVTPRWGGRSKPCIQFSSRISRGEYLVREILRREEWPPGSD